MVPTVQKTMEITQSQCIGEMVDVPAEVAVQAPHAHAVEKTVEISQLQAAEKIVETRETQTIQGIQTSENFLPDDPDAETKFLAEEALHGVGGFIFDAHGNRVANGLGKRDCVTGEMWENRPPFSLALNRAASDEIAPHCKHYTESGVRKLHESGTALAEDPEAPVSKMPDSSEAHDQASLKSAKDRDGEPYPAFASEKSRTEASGKTGSEKKFYHNVSSGADFAAQPPVTTMTVASTVLTADTVPRRQVPMIPNMQKTVEVPQIQYVDKIVDVPVAVTQPSVSAEAERESCSKKRKSAFESDEMVDEASDLDAFGLVQGEECTRVVDESEVQGPEDGLVPVAPNMGAGGSHPQATLNQEWAEDMREIRRMVEFLVRRERKLDAKADVAIRRLERLERENLQLEDDVLETSLPEALADRTKVVKLVVDKWFVDKGFGFGKVPSGEVVFIHASAVQGAEVLMIGTEAWVQVVSDDARAQGGFRARRAWGKTAWEQERDRERASKAAERARRAAELTAELAAQSERAVSEVCTHPPGLPRDEPTAERSVAPTTGESPFLAGGDSLLSGRSSLAPRPRGARARSIARNVDAKSLVDVTLDFYVKATGEDGVQMRQKLANMSQAALQQNRERWQKRAEEVQRFQDKREEARAFFRRQGGLEERFEREFKQQVMRSIGHNREDDEKSLDKWTNELRAKAEAEEIKKMRREDVRS